MENQQQQQQQGSDRYVPRLERQGSQNQNAKTNYDDRNNSHNNNNNVNNNNASQQRSRTPELERRYSRTNVEKKTLLNMYRFIQNQNYLLTDEERSTLAQIQFNQLARTGFLTGLGVSGGVIAHRMAKRATSLPAPPSITPLLRNPLTRALSHPWSRPLLLLSGAFVGINIASKNTEQRLLERVTELESPLGAMVRISLRESNSPQAQKYLDDLDFQDQEDRDRLNKYIQKLKLRNEKFQHEESRAIQNVDDYGTHGYLRGPAIYFDSSGWEDTYGTGRDNADEFKLPEFVRPDDDLDFHPELLGYDGFRIKRKIDALEEEEEEYEYDVKTPSLPPHENITAMPELNARNTAQEE